MGFQGNLDSVSFADILQLLAMGKKTGTLVIERQDSRKEICFKDGSIIWATSNSEDDLMENQMLKQGRITKQDLIKAKEVMELTSKDLPSTLVFLGLFKKEDVADIMLKHVEAIIYDVFGWDHGAFVFKDNELPDSQFVMNALNTMNILMEGTRRIDEWTRIRSALPPDNTVLQVTPSALSQSEEIRLSPAEAQILSLIDGDRSLEEIKEKSPFGELDTAHALYGLKMAGLIRKAGVKESKKAVIAEQKRLLQITVRLYDIFFEIVREAMTSKLGKGAAKKLINAYKEVSKTHEILEHIDVADDGKFGFVNFLTLVERLPESSRIHLVSGGLSALLAHVLDAVQNTVGGRQKKQILSQAIVETEELITENSELLKKYGVYSDLTRIIQD